MTEIPEGWKLVPIESTGPMVQAGWEATGMKIPTSLCDAIWDAMVAAAPKP